MNTTKKKSNIPLRRCMVTGVQLPKASLLRLVRTPQGQLVIDPTGKLNGRGAYVQKDVNLLDRLKKTQLLKKQFAVVVDDAFYELLAKAMHA
jgi:predicted RNA-binding protein YlxR (DUF448 family)